MRFKNSVVIVTGGTSGIGKSTVDLFLSEGAKTIVIDVKPPKVKKKEHVRNMYFFKGDVSKENEISEIIGYVSKRFKKIDVLFNNAGLYFRKDTLSLSLEEWERVLRVNLTSVFVCCRCVIPYMVDRNKGAIINISSIDALWGEESTVAYCASKGGIIALTKSLAREFAKCNIRINCVVPGPVLTPMFRENNTLQEMVYIKNHVPLGRLGVPKDIANAVLFLASDDASFITGKVLVVDGGII